MRIPSLKPPQVNIKAEDCEKEPFSIPPREENVHLKVHVVIEALDDYIKKHYEDSLHPTFAVAMHMLHRVAPHVYDHHKTLLQKRTIERNR